MFIWKRHQNLHRFCSGSPPPSLSPGPEVVYWAISSYRYWASQMAPHLQIASLPEWADALNRRRARLKIRKSFPSQLLPSSCRWCEQQTSKHFTRDLCRLRFPCKPDQARHPLGKLWDIFRSRPKNIPRPNLVIFIFLSQNTPFFYFPDFLPPLLGGGGVRGGFTQILVRRVWKCPTLLSALIHSTAAACSPLFVIFNSSAAFFPLLNCFHWKNPLMSCNVAPNVV